MTILTGQADVFAAIKNNEQARILTVPSVFIEHVGIAAGIMLSQMLYWTDRTNPDKNPERRFYRTNIQWQEELKMTEARVKNALKKLKKVGVIETKVITIKHGVTTLYRVAMGLITDWINGTLGTSGGVGRKPPDPSGENHPTPRVENTHSYIKEMIVNKTKEIDEKAVASPTAKKKFIQFHKTLAGGRIVLYKKPRKIIERKKGPTTSGQVKKNLKEQMQESISVPVGKPTPRKAASMWSKMVPRYNETITFVKSIADHGKEMGQLRKIINIITEAKEPPLEVIAITLKDWVRFTSFVKEQKGLTQVPLVPDYGFLLLSVTEAIEYFRNTEILMPKEMQLTSQDIPVSSSKAVSVPGQVGMGVGVNEFEKIVNEEEQPATYEEILAINKTLFGVKDGSSN